MITAKQGRRHPLWHDEMGECAMFEWQGPQPLFALFLDLDTGDERRFKKAHLRLSLTRQGPAVVFAAEWKNWVTLAAPFHAGLAAALDLPADARPVLPERDPENGLVLPLHLIDVDSGRFAAERRIIVSPPFACALVAEARRQLAEGIDQDAYSAAVDAFHDELEDPADLFSAAISLDRPSDA